MGIRRNEEKLTPKRAIEVLKRGLKLYHPDDFVSFFNCRRMYREFWNDIKRVLDMVEEELNNK